jgi:hypothetical protein
MKQEVHLNGEHYVVEASSGKYVVSKKDGTPSTEEVILVLRAISEGKGKPLK